MRLLLFWSPLGIQPGVGSNHGSERYHAFFSRSPKLIDQGNSSGIEKRPAKLPGCRLVRCVIRIEDSCLDQDGQNFGRK